jgi:hypothetical protein
MTGEQLYISGAAAEETEPAVAHLLEADEVDEAGSRATTAAAAEPVRRAPSDGAELAALCDRGAAVDRQQGGANPEVAFLGGWCAVRRSSSSLMLLRFKP